MGAPPMLYLHLMKVRGIFRNWRLLSAAFFAAALVSGAYWLAYGEGAQTVEASTQTALLKEIATKDSTGDGLPDWQKVLYGIPLNATTTDYFNLGMTDGEAVAQGLIVPKAVVTVPTTEAGTQTGAASAGTLTASFAQYFFSLYLNAKQANGGVELTADETNTLADTAMNELTQSYSLEANIKTGADIHVSGSGNEAMRMYAANAEAVFAKYQGTSSTTEIDDLQSAVQNNDASAVVRLATTAQIYKNYAKGLLALSVPQELAANHIALINVLLLRSTVDMDLSHVQTDPLAALTALKQFSDTESTLWNVFSLIAARYAAAGIILPNGTPGANFVNVLANANQR